MLVPAQNNPAAAAAAAFNHQNFAAAAAAAAAASGLQSPLSFTGTPILNAADFGGNGGMATPSSLAVTTAAAVAGHNTSAGNGAGTTQKDTTFTKIFVGGLPYHTSDKSLRDHFEAYGEIEEAVVITDRQTGKSRGYGFVTMADRLGAERACKEPNPIIDGRKANVNLAILGAKPRGNAALNGCFGAGTPFAAGVAAALRPQFHFFNTALPQYSVYGAQGSPYMASQTPFFPQAPSLNPAAAAAAAASQLAAAGGGHANAAALLAAANAGPAMYADQLYQVPTAAGAALNNQLSAANQAANAASLYSNGLADAYAGNDLQGSLYPTALSNAYAQQFLQATHGAQGYASFAGPTAHQLSAMAAHYQSPGTVTSAANVDSRLQ